MDWDHLFFGFEGRISRMPYWIASCVLAVAGLLSLWIGYRFNNDRLSDILDLALLYPTAAVIFKRGHDRETAPVILIGYLVVNALLGAISILGLAGTAEGSSALYWAAGIPSLALALYLLVELGIRKGVRGPNRFGPDPLQQHTRSQ